MGAPTDDTVTVVNKDNQSTDVPASDLDAWAARGWHPEDETARANRVGTAARQAAQGIAAPIALGALRTITGGGSDAVMRALGGEDARVQLRQQAEDSPGLTMAGELGAAALPIGLPGKLGKLGEALSKAPEGAGFAESVGRAAFGRGVEGGAFGLGAGVSELALSDDPLTVDHIVGTLGSNMLLGSGIGGVTGGAFKAGERALSKAGSVLREASAAKSALDTLPADLQGLDEAGLKAAGKEAAAAHQADIAAERQSLEEIRVNQRAETANMVRDFHNELATERPLYKAVQGADVQGIDGVKDVAAKLGKSFTGLRNALDNEVAVARDPGQLMRHLEMQQGALEGLQAKVPELQAKLAGDARGAALDYVDEALAKNKELQAQIQALSKANPVQSGRLTMLEAGPSSRMQAIEAAQKAMKEAPELSGIGKMVKGAAFGGGTALAHMIPGVGIAAPFVGKAASDMVGKAFEALSGGVRTSVMGHAAAAEKFLAPAIKGAQKVQRVLAPTATDVLRSVRFGPDIAAKGDSLADHFAARSQELRQQVEYGPDGSLQMRQQARQALAQKLDPIRSVNPQLADKIETSAATRTLFMASKLPKKPEVSGMQIGPDKYKPSDLEMRSFARTVRACEDPAGVEQRLANGYITPEDAEAYRVCYPERYQALQTQIMAQAPALSRTLPVNKKVALFIATGVPTMPALAPNVLQVLQSSFAVEPGSNGGTEAPKPRPEFGALGSMKDLDKPTPAQERGG